MTTYHVWIDGQEQPEVVRALEVSEQDGELWFALSPPVLGESGTIRLEVRRFEPDQWSRWAIVEDDADRAPL